MPSLEMENPIVPGVSAVSSLLEELLQHAEIVKQTTSIEPALATSDFEDIPARLAQALAPAGSPEDTDENGDLSKARRFAIIETVARDRFSNLIVSGGRRETV
jgi:THO complex subunit 1